MSSSYTQAAGPTDPQFESFTSVVSRQIGGIPVPESFAWATINADEDVVEESVFWPDVPANAIADARALVAMLTDASKVAAFKANLPAGLAGAQSEGGVAIHHSPCTPGRKFAAVASYDVLERLKPASGRERHFDIGGHELIFDFERSQAVASEKRPSRAQP